MSSTVTKPLLWGAALAVGISSLFATVAQAQTVYRIVGADGKVTYSDKPPAPAANAKVTTGTGASSGGASTAGLPFEVAQVANKYPVTLYTSEKCVPCGTGRAMLSNRGIPFAEKTVSTPEDSQALQRISGDTSLPFLTIGGQQIKGFSDAEWTQFLDAAGYPKTSVLPPSYRQAAATPLVTVTAPAAATNDTPAARAQPTARATAPAAPPPANNPAGIRF